MAKSNVYKDHFNPFGAVGHNYFEHRNTQTYNYKQYSDETEDRKYPIDVALVSYLGIVTYSKLSV